MRLPHESVLCQYRYDALDRLIGQTPAATPEHQRFYNINRLATEIQGAVRHSILQQGDLLLAQQRSCDGAIDTSLLATDQQRSVMQTCKANQQRQPMAYSPYGYRAVENGLLSLLGFNGGRPDPVTGHYLLGNGYRAFNPMLMRFNSPDSLSPFGKGGLNSYTYCLGDPINRSDNNGHISFNTVRQIVYNLYNRWNKASQPSFRSNQESIFAQIKTIKEEWKYSIDEISSTGSGKRVRLVENDGKTVVVRNLLTNENRYYKPNQTLQESAYSMVHSQDIQKLPKNNSFQNTDIQIDVNNMKNAISKKIAHHEKQGKHPSQALRLAIKDINNDIMNNNIRGVNTKRIKLNEDYKFAIKTFIP